MTPPPATFVGAYYALVLIIGASLTVLTLRMPREQAHVIRVFYQDTSLPTCAVPRVPAGQECYCLRGAAPVAVCVKVPDVP